MENKMDAKSAWAVGGCTLIGVGVGFFYLQTAPLWFVACILIGVGTGLLIGSLLSKRG